jgi:hypothetical protein
MIGEGRPSTPSLRLRQNGVDGRDKPGHDDGIGAGPAMTVWVWPTASSGSGRAVVHGLFTNF